MRFSRRCALSAVLLWLGGCPIAPDFPTDAGTADGGANDGGATDGGTGDGGVTGSVSATLMVSDQLNTVALAWNNAELGNSTLDSSSQATIRAVDVSTLAGYGTLTMVITGLAADTVGGSLSQLSYATASGTDSWTCGALNNCTYTLTIGSFDGATLTGVFAVNLGVDAAGNTGALNGGSFAVTFP